MNMLLLLCYAVEALASSGPGAARSEHSEDSWSLLRIDSYKRLSSLVNSQLSESGGFKTRPFYPQSFLLFRLNHAGSYICEYIFIYICMTQNLLLHT